MNLYKELWYAAFSKPSDLSHSTDYALEDVCLD